MPRTLQRAAIILTGSIALGLLANAVSPKGIPYSTPPKVELSAKEIISLEEANRLWGSGAAFFLDARSPADYAAGHIANAFSLPEEDFQAHWPQIAPMLTPEARIVAYCDGVECELSHSLAGKLRALGYTNVHVLVNGWTVWRAAGLSTQTGTQP